jgi:hypothetical protein
MDTIWGLTTGVGGILLSLVFEPVDTVISAVDCFGGSILGCASIAPLVPSAVGKIGKYGDDVVDGTRAVDQIGDTARATENTGDAGGYVRDIPERQVGTSRGFKTFKGEDGLSVFEDVSPDEVLAELPGVREPNTTVTIPKTELPTGTRVIPTDAPGLSKRLSDAHRILVRPEGWSVDRFAQQLKKIVGWE